MPKIALADARPDQLRHHASVVMQLDVSPNNTGPQLIAKMQAADPSLVEIEVPEETNQASAPIANRAPPADQAVAGRELNTSYHDDPKVLVMVPGSKEPGGDKDVQVGVNGDTWLLRRDEEVRIPYRVHLALKAAKELEINQTIPKPGVPATISVREVLSYPYQVLEMPPAAEIAAFHARVDNAFAP